MHKNNENAQNYPSGITSRLRDFFARKWLNESDVLPVGRPALTAFVTGNVSISEYWDYKIEDSELSKRWKKYAHTLKEGVPVLTTTGFLEPAEIAISAISDVAKIINIRGDNKTPEFPIPRVTLGILASATTSLKLLWEVAIIKQGRKEQFAEPLRVGTLYYKARALFNIGSDRYCPHDQIPTEALEYAVIPVLEDIGISLNANNPVAQGWERLGHMIEDAGLNSGNGTAKHTFSLYDHIRLATAICEAKNSGRTNVEIPRYIIKNLCTVWREQALQNAVLAKAAESIEFQLAPWFDHVSHNARSDNTPGY